MQGCPDPAVGAELCLYAGLLYPGRLFPLPLHPGHLGPTRAGGGRRHDSCAYCQSRLHRKPALAPPHNFGWLDVEPTFT